MDEAYLNPRTAEKEKVKEMLRDAIRILCQNTVSYHTNLSVEALVGITVDDGEDSFFVSINESVSVANSKADHTEAQYQNTEADYPDYDTQEISATEDNQYNSIVSYNQQYNPSLPYQAVVKKEESVITYNTGHYNGFPSNNMSSNNYVEHDGSYSAYESAGYGYQESFDARSPRVRKVTASGAPRGRGRGQRASQQKITSARNMPVLKQEIGVEKDARAADVKMCSGVDSSEVSQVYTCQRCGKQMSRYASFLRHKKSHLGIVYRCDGCGKVLSRSDHLTAHKRNCQAAQQLAAFD